MTLRCLAALACFTAVSSYAPEAAAQQGTTSLVGSVTDASSGQPVVDAVVTVTSPNLQGEEIAVSDESGSYRIQGLPPGVYTLRVESDTFRPYARTELDLHADTTIRLNVSLLPEAIKAQEVVIKGRTPTVDVGSSATGMNITSEFTGRVPVIAPGGKNSAGRSFESVADVVPGAHPDTFGVSIFGSSSPENRYLLDGLSVNNPTFGVIGTPLAIDFIKEVSVLSGGYMPEYGRSTGGVINAITKSGTNEWHGSVFTNWSPGGIAGNPKRVTAEGQTISTKPQLDYQGDVGGDVGGPLIKDKLWIYAGFDWARTRIDLKRQLYRTVLGADGQPIVDAATGETQRELIPGSQMDAYAQQDQFQGLTKLTWAVNKKHRLNLSLNGVYPVSGGKKQFGIDPRSGTSEIQSGSTTLANGINGPYSAIAHKYQASSTNVALKWSAELLKDRAFLDTWLGYHQERFGKMPSDGSGFGNTTGLAGRSNVWFTANDPPRNLNELDPSVTGCDVPGSCPVQDYRLGGPESIEQQKTHRIQGRSVFTYLFQGLGHHVFKAGLDMEYQRHHGIKAYTGGIDFVEGSRAMDGEWIQQLGYGYLTGVDKPLYLDRLDNQTRSLSVGGFVQDSWNVADIVTVNLGLRYDAQLMYGRDNSLAMSLPNQWSPRVGAVWDPTREGRAKIFTNFSRYFETVPLRMLDRYLSGEPILVSNSTSATCNVLDPNQTRAGGACTNQSSLVDGFGYPPNSKYLGFAQGTSLIDPKLKAPSTDEFVVGAEYEVLKDGRAGLVYTKRWLHNTIEDMSRDAGSTFFFGNPGRGLARDFPKAERKYDALTAYFVKQFSDGWLTQASYTVSWLRGNYSGLYRAEDQQFDPHQNSDFDLDRLTANRWGPLPGDHRHYIKVFGAKEFEIPKGGGVITPGASVRAYSGDPTNYLGSDPLYLVDQVYILPRGAGDRLPWTSSVDLRLAYGFNISKDRGLVATMDIFNLFNFQSAVARDQRYTTSTVDPIEGGKRGDLANATTLDGASLTDSRNPNFGRVSARQPPRVFRFGLKGTF